MEETHLPEIPPAARSRGADTTLKPAREKYYKVIFLAAAVYDLALGIVFTFFQESAFRFLGIAEKLPEVEGYLSLIGAFLFVIGCAYWLIFRGDLQRNRDLITVGALYKLAYCAIAFYYFAIGTIPHVAFVAVFGVADLIFLIMVVECPMGLGGAGAELYDEVDGRRLELPPGTAAMEDILEIAIPWSVLKVSIGEQVRFHLSLVKDGSALTTWPMSGAFSVVVPEEDFERRMWSV